jgi:Ca2+-transporting ATPase
VVTAVGLDSEWGKTLALVVCESPDTPLQEKLSDLAASVGKIGAFVAVITFIVLLIRYVVLVDAARNR